MNNKGVTMKVKIEAYDHLGRGIAKIDGKVVFVPYTKKGETVEIEIVEQKKNYAVGKLLPLPSDTPSFCPYYGKCGGCQLQHLSYEEQLEYKQELVKNQLERYASIKLEELPPIMATKPKAYRNKVTLHIEGNQLGFYQNKTHRLFPITTCPILDPAIEKLIPVIKTFIETNRGLNQAVMRVLDRKIMLSLKGKADEAVIINYFSTYVDSLYYNNRLIAGVRSLETTIFGKRFMVAGDAFFQVNDLGMRKIYQQVIDWIPKEQEQVILDLYCGTGTMTLLLAEVAKQVIGVEINEQAIMSARENAHINKVDNVIFYAGSTAAILPLITTPLDFVVVDPPRAGLDEVTRSQLLEFLPKKIIYVSCNPLTLARDLQMLAEQYQLEDIKLVDEFPETYHVECCALLSLRKTKIS